MMRKVAQFVPKYLPHSENFIYNLTSKLPGISSSYFTMALENSDIFPAEVVVVRANESLYSEEFKRIKPQLVHAHFGGSGPAGLAYALSYQLPLLTSFYGHDASSFLNNPPWPGYFSHLFEAGSLFLVLSEFMKKQLLDAGCPHDKIAVLRVGVDLERFKPKDSKGKSQITRFLMCSRFVEKKGVRYAIEAFSLLSHDFPDVELTIVGDGILKDSLRNQINQSGLQDKVTLVAKMGQEEVLKHLRNADAFIYPSVTASDGDCEGTPVTIMEAAACGLPIIATQHAGIPELIVEGETGMLVPQKNVMSLKESMEKLHLNPTMAREMGAKGRQFIKDNYNIEDKRQELTEIYHDLINRKAYYRLIPPEKAYQRILVIRSIPLMDFLHKLFVIKEKYPYTEIYVLTNSSTVELCHTHPLIDLVIPFKESRYSPLNFKGGLKRTLRNKNFYRVIVPFTSRKGEGFENVFAFAKLIKTKKTLGLSPDGRWTNISWLIVLKLKARKNLSGKIIKKSLVLLGAGLAIVVLSIIYLIVKIIRILKHDKKLS